MGVETYKWLDPITKYMINDITLEENQEFWGQTKWKCREVQIPKTKDEQRVEKRKEKHMGDFENEKTYAQIWKYP